MQPYELQNVVCHIPGTDPEAGEIIFSAHLFEGYVKQGANDNKSGSAGILEVARTLHTLIEEGRLPRPKRTIRFLVGTGIFRHRTLGQSPQGDSWQKHCAISIWIWWGSS